jgi:hypothetical protein
VRGVLESLLKTKKYVIPLAVLHPAIVASLSASYLSGGRFNLARGAESSFAPEQVVAWSRTGAIPSSAPAVASEPATDRVKGGAEVPRPGAVSGAEHQTARAGSSDH